MHTKNYPQPLLGAHLSIAGGFEQAIYAAQQLGCTAVQFFSKSNRQWHAPAVTQEQLDRYQQALSAYPLYVAIHASYLINLASSDKAQRTKARQALLLEYERAVALSASTLVVHPGSHGTGSPEDALLYVSDELTTLFAQLPTGATIIALETMAGQGTSICSTFQELKTILDNTNNKRLGVCLDTCHIYAAGYDLSAHYEAVMQSFDTTIGLNHLHVIHVNDSKKGLGSRVDRHEHIGKGQLGLNAYAQLMQDPRLVSIPKILETPKDTPEDDAQNLAILRGLL